MDHANYVTTAHPASPDTQVHMGPGARPIEGRTADYQLPATEELVTLGAPLELRDGSTVRIRRMRSSDDELLLRGFERLSPESRYRRFLAPVPELSSRMVRYLTDLDHRDREAMIALDGQCQEGLGIARYVRDPKCRDAAEVAVTVIDDWQGRGLGTLLLEAISARARDEGVETFTALMLAQNHEMRDLLEALGPVRTIDQDAGTVEVEVPIPPVGVAPALSKLLGIAAEHDIAVPLMPDQRPADEGRPSPSSARRASAPRR
jgi:GNAT superfamily N-acetyltransferase